jgi:hypothetical protein
MQSWASCGFFGRGRLEEGALTTAIGIAGPMRTAIMSLATRSPKR